MCLPENIASCLKEADRDVYPNISTLLTIGCTLPVSSCEAERSFSGLRRSRHFYVVPRGETCDATVIWVLKKIKETSK